MQETEKFLKRIEPITTEMSPQMEHRTRVINTLKEGLLKPYTIGTRTKHNKGKDI